MNINLKFWQYSSIKQGLISFTMVFAIFALIHILASPAYCWVFQDMKDMKKELSETKEDISNLKKELQEIKKLLKTSPMPPRRPPTPKVSEASIDDDPMLGDSNAPLTLIEFSEFQCPYCARFHNQVFPQIKKEYIDTGKLRYVFRDFPLSMHKTAQKAAEAAQCAGEQGKYWEMHELLFKKPKGLAIDKIKEYAEELHLDTDRFNACLDNDKYTEEVKKDMKDGQQAGVRGTPSFVLGKTTKDGNIKGPFIRGAKPYEAFKAEIDKLLGVGSKQ